MASNLTLAFPLLFIFSLPYLLLFILGFFFPLTILLNSKLIARFPRFFSFFSQAFFFFSAVPKKKMKFAKHLEKESIPEWRKAYLNYKSLKKRLKLVDEHRKLSEQQAALELDHAFYRRHTDSFDAGMPQRWPSNAISYWHTNTDWPFPTHNIDDKLSNKLDPPLFDTSKGLNVRPTSGSSPVGYGTTSNLDDVLFHASHSERLFFDLLNKELEKVALFYDEKENEAKAKLEALKMQLHLIADYGRHFLTPAHDTGTDSIFDWLKHQPLSADVTFNVARSRLKKALTEFYRSLEFLRSYKSLNETGFQKILKKFDKRVGRRVRFIIPR
ncbi:SPX domain-containing protein [Radiomyces spectabilis]|uniref:SPX domain-containing protein n=1 Tax=Radiomyces spectabilis TaxID=64574 RepID=UPI00221F324E|nr:SPX domain-containing protein [Radiomyces spectabilis]KAI8373199.1 SPX domain-containing protein [Radiomyces spectabilis]